MKLGWLLGIFCAVAFHAGVLLFGGLVFKADKKDRGSLQEVQLLSEEEASLEKKEEAKEPADEEDEELTTETEQAPDAAEIMRNLELSAAPVPALDAASLGALEQALSGLAGTGDFADALSFSSGGRIGGTGKGGPLEQSLESAFSLAEIDQKPRAIFQAAPLYPAEMRGEKLEGVVSIIFVVDPAGKVTNPRVEKSSHPAFEKPAMEAVRQWKFEPAVRAGQRVGCKMRVPIRFPPNGR